jgi:outer membrane protein assembly factor BamB
MLQPPDVSANSEPGEARLSANALIVPQDQGVAAYDLVTGRPLWRAPTGQSPVVWVAPDQRIYALTYTANNTPDHLSALDAATGHTIWSKDVSPLPSLGLAPVGDGDVYLTTPTRTKLDESVIALDGSGAARWRFDGKSPYNSGDILASGGALYYIWQSPDAVDGVKQADVTYITSLSASDGSMRWQMALPGVNGDPVTPLLAP